MEATSFIEKIKRIDTNQFAVTISVSISNLYLQLLKNNDKKITSNDKMTYKFILTVLDHKFHMNPEDRLGECMEMYDNNETCAELTPFQRKQWCAGALTHKIVNHMLSTDLLNPFFLLDIPMTAENDLDLPNCEDEVSPIGAMKEKLRDIENSVENFIELLDGMQVSSAISGKATCQQ
jgi:hypothetical protein